MMEIAFESHLSIEDDLDLARATFINTVPRIIEILSALVGASTDTTTDIKEVLMVLT